MCWLFFFFQAEDGIRYLVRSRGLGDVYKRQDLVYSYNFSEVPSATTALGIPGLPDAQLMGTVRRNRRMIDEMVFSAQTTSIRPNITFVQGDQTVVPVSYTHLTLPTSDLV